MRRFVHTAAAAMVALAFFTISCAAQGIPTNRPGQFWGTYLHQMQVGPGMSMPVLITFHIDGTVTGASAVMFSGLPGAPARYSPVFGIWRRTDSNSIATTGMFMAFDAATGVLTGFARSRARLDFSDGFNSYTGSEYLEVTPCASPLACNPLDPNAVWTPLAGMPPTGFTSTGTRLELLMPPSS